MQDLRTLRIAAMLEATTLLALCFVAVPLKYLAGIPQLSTILGPIHGFVFLSFGWITFQSYSAGEITGKDLIRLIIGACIPFGGFWNERWLREMAKEK